MSYISSMIYFIFINFCEKFLTYIFKFINVFLIAIKEAHFLINWKSSQYKIKVFLRCF